MWMPFNCNEYVRVQLNDHGRAVMHEYTDRFNRQYPGANLEPMKAEEDADGWSQWQLWDLMEVFGHTMGMGKTPPFSLEIQLRVKETV